MLIVSGGGSFPRLGFSDSARFLYCLHWSDMKCEAILAESRGTKLRRWPWMKDPALVRCFVM